MRNSRVNSITYGAVMCALVGALLLVNRQLAGAFDLYLYWIIPIPVIVYCLKFGTKQSFVLVASMVLLSFVVATPVTVFYVAGSAIAGVVYGDGVLKGKSSTYLICSLIGVSLLMMIITTFIFASFFGFNVADELRLYQDMVSEVFGTMGATNEGMAQAIQNILSGNILMTILVISYVLTSVLEGFLVHLISILVLRKLKMTVPPMKPLSMVFAPGWLKLFVFAAIFASVVSSFTGVSEYNEIIIPLSAVAYCICFGFGYILMATFAAIVNQGKKKKAVSSLLILAIAFVFPIIVVGLGFVDMYSSIRLNLLMKVRGNANE